MSCELVCWNCSSMEAVAFGPRPGTWACKDCELRTFTDIDGKVHVLAEGEYPVYRDGLLTQKVDVKEFLKERQRYITVTTKGQVERKKDDGGKTSG